MPGVTLPWYFYLVGLPSMLTLPVVMLVLLGVGWVLARREHLALSCALCAGCIVVWFSFDRYKELRLITGVLPFVAVLAAVGLTRALSAPVLARPLLLLVVLAAVGAASWRSVSTEIGSSVTNGYPSFLHAMDRLRRDSPPGARIVGAAGPQIAWYADRAVIDDPEEAGLAALIPKTDWFVVTNFERGQRAYVGELAKRITLIDVAARSALRFNDERCETLLLRPALVRALIARQVRAVPLPGPPL